MSAKYKPTPFLLDDATDFVLHTASTVRNPPHLRSPHSVRCIDHRIDGEPPPIAIPGAKLGVLFAALAAKKILEIESSVQIPLEFGDMATIVERELSVLTFHTDTEHHGRFQRNEPVLPCAGCGHCHSAFTYPDEYLLSEEDILFLEEYVLGLTDGGINPVVYPGTGKARALMIIDSLDIMMPPLSGNSGARVYVYNRAAHRRILAIVARALYERLPSPQVAVGTVTNAFFTAGEKQFQATGNRLAHGLPQFRVFREAAAISVEPLQSVQEQTNPVLRV